jgi:hypothetical protein
MLNADSAKNRRVFLKEAVFGAAAGRLLIGTEVQALIDNAEGGFRFRKGGNKFSSGGAVANPGHEIVHVTFAAMPSMAQGFARINEFLNEQRRPSQALCGVELRSPKPFNFAEFGKLSDIYMDLVAKPDRMVKGANPVARVNVAPELDPPTEVSMFGFSFAAPRKDAGANFLAASGELSGAYPDGIVARGDTSTNGLRQKVTRELENIDKALGEMNVDWAAVTTFSVFTVHDIHPLLRELLLPRMGVGKNAGLRLYFARPPIEQLEIELQVRACSRELVIAS